MLRSFLFSGVLSVVGLWPGLSAEAMADDVEKIDLFEAEKDGYELYRIPGIVVTKSGTVLAYCEARKSAKGDWGRIDVLLRRSVDGGRTWQPRQQLVKVDGDLPINPVAAAQNLDRPGENTVNNPVAIVDQQTGAIHFLYCLEYMRCFYMRSDDDGQTWTDAVEITPAFDAFRRDYDWKVLATGPGHAIQLTKGDHAGRLVVPVWLSLGTGGHAHRPSVTSTIYSDDHGRTWHRGDIAVPDTDKFIYPNETAVVQLADGRVMLNSRTESKANRRVITISPDGATNWSVPRFDDALVEPVCMAGVVRVREPRGDQPGTIAFSNPNNLTRKDGKEAPGKGRDRINVTVRLSHDEGQTWPDQRLLEEGFSGYSDLAVLPDGTILCFYERGSTDGVNIYRTGRLTVARFTENWVRQGAKVTGSEPRSVSGKKPMKVFILAGQSNMEGHARIETFDYIGDDPATAHLLKQMTDDQGKPTVCDGAWISYYTGGGDQNGEGFGPLTAGYGSRQNPAESNGKIGPEFTFGLAMDAAFEEPVLIIKTAWGGKSLFYDYRPPGAGVYHRTAQDIERDRNPEDHSGHYYRLMLQHVKQVLADPGRVCPKYDADAGFELAGFVWFQGFNDMVNRDVYPVLPKDSPENRFATYSTLLAQFIRDVRKDLNAPELPFVIGVMGVGGKNVNPDNLQFREAMTAPALLPEFKNTVTAVPTATYWDETLGAIQEKYEQVRQMSYLLRTKNPNHANADGKMTEADQKAYLEKYEADLISPDEVALRQRGSSNAGYHYLGSAKTFALIGEAFASEMLKLQKTH
ncbi:MAG: exo-alpha-sialidase [Planctomycetaceae bacterium]